MDIFRELWKEMAIYIKIILQIIALRSKENSEILIVCNTHLFFRPEAKHIRLLQAYYCLVYSQNFAREIKEKVLVSICPIGNLYNCNTLHQLLIYDYFPEPRL